MAESNTSTYDNQRQVQSEADRWKSYYEGLSSAKVGSDWGNQIKFLKQNYKEVFDKMFADVKDADKLGIGDLATKASHRYNQGTFNVVSYASSMSKSIYEGYLQKNVADDKEFREKQILAAQGILGRGAYKKAQMSTFASPVKQQTDIFQDKGILQQTIPQNSFDLLG